MTGFNFSKFDLSLVTLKGSPRWSQGSLLRRDTFALYFSGRRWHRMQTMIKPGRYT